MLLVAPDSEQTSEMAELMSASTGSCGCSKRQGLQTIAANHTAVTATHLLPNTYPSRV